MLTEADKGWLAEHYPGLQETDGGLAGMIHVEATYNKVTNRFLNLRNGSHNTEAGIQLKGDFKVQVRPRTTTPFSCLPALTVDDVEWSVDRHFNQNDKTGCLCSPLEEDEFLTPELQFRRYMDELVTPFLYGQLFYSTYGYWPWSEYEHGPLGLLESYSKRSDPTKASECLEKLRRYPNEWPAIQTLLRMKVIKGHAACFCHKRDYLRRCHPSVLRGVRLLLTDLREQKISF